jgi:hypothetical protein
MFGYNVRRDYHEPAPPHNGAEKRFFIITVRGGQEDTVIEFGGNKTYQSGNARPDVDNIDILVPYDLRYRADHPYHVKERFFSDRQIIMARAYPVQLPDEPSAGRYHDRLMALLDKIPRQVDRPGLHPPDFQRWQNLQYIHIIPIFQRSAAPTAYLQPKVFSSRPEFFRVLSSVKPLDNIITRVGGTPVAAFLGRKFTLGM